MSERRRVTCKSNAHLGIKGIGPLNCYRSKTSLENEHASIREQTEYFGTAQFDVIQLETHEGMNTRGIMDHSLVGK